MSSKHLIGIVLLAVPLSVGAYLILNKDDEKAPTPPPEKKNTQAKVTVLDGNESGSMNPSNASGASEEQNKDTSKHRGGPVAIAKAGPTKGGERRAVSPPPGFRGAAKGESDLKDTRPKDQQRALAKGRKPEKRVAQKPPVNPNNLINPNANQFEMLDQLLKMHEQERKKMGQPIPANVRPGVLGGLRGIQQAMERRNREIDELLEVINGKRPIGRRGKMNRPDRIPPPVNFPPEDRFPPVEPIPDNRFPPVDPGRPQRSVGISRLGIQVIAPTPTLADQLELPKAQGLIVTQVRKDSPADKAGIKSHDILLEIDGNAISNNKRAFTTQLGKIKPNSEISVVVLRKGLHSTLKGLKLP